MALLPVIDEEVVADFDYSQEPGHTYRMKVDLEDGTAGQIIGYVDGRDAVEQAAYKILNTERGENEIYQGQYGVETDDLLGMPIAYVCPEYERRSREALLMDDRITGTGNYTFEIPSRGVLNVALVITTIYGDIEMNQSIEVA